MDPPSVHPLSSSSHVCTPSGAPFQRTLQQILTPVPPSCTLFPLHPFNALSMQRTPYHIPFPTHPIKAPLLQITPSIPLPQYPLLMPPHLLRKPKEGAHTGQPPAPFPLPISPCPPGAQRSAAAVPCTLHLPADDDKWRWGCTAHCAGVGGCGQPGGGMGCADPPSTTPPRTGCSSHPAAGEFPEQVPP